MTVRSLAIASVVMLLLGLVASSAEARPFRGRFTGAITSTEVDINGDGVTASVAHSEVRGSLGRGFARSVTEWGPLAPAAGACDGLGLGDGPLVRASLVYTENVTTYRNGSQLLARGETGYLCVNLVTGAIAGETESDLLGGSGRYAGATGTTTVTFRAQALSPAAPMLSFSGTTRGDINK